MSCARPDGRPQGSFFEGLLLGPGRSGKIVARSLGDDDSEQGEAATVSGEAEAERIWRITKEISGG